MSNAMNDTNDHRSLDEIADRVLALGRANRSAKTGSFGEYVFAHVARARGHRVELMHANRIDFYVDGIPVDVKTPPTRMGEQLLPAKRWPGSRLDDVTYAQVEVAREAIRVTWEDRFTEVVSWADVQPAAEQWAKKERWDLPAAAEKEANEAAWKAVRTELRTFLAEHGTRCHPIYRTVQAGFGPESPGNLVLERFGEGDLRVFVSYNRWVREDALEYVIAFPCSAGATLPMRPDEKNKLGIAKVDLEALPERYRFATLDELRAGYSRVF